MLQPGDQYGFDSSQPCKTGEPIVSNTMQKTTTAIFPPRHTKLLSDVQPTKSMTK